MALLTHSNPSMCSSLLLVEQLLYLAHGDRYLQELDITLGDEQPTSPSCISHELWQTLHKIPLSTDFFSGVIKSVHDNPDFWESLSSPDEMVESPNFPWKLSDSVPSSGLDEFVLLNCLCPQVVSDKLLALANPLVELIQVPQLRDIVLGDNSHPLLLFHNRECPVSQANMLELNNELKKCLPVRTPYIVHTTLKNP